MGNTVKLMFGKIPETVGDELLAIHRLVTSELTTEQVRFLQAMQMWRLACELQT